jgi:hypothetical protein
MSYTEHSRRAARWDCGLTASPTGCGDPEKMSYTELSRRAARWDCGLTTIGEFTMTRNLIYTTILIIFVTFSISCNNRPKLERPEGMPELHPCSVTVTFGGQAIEGVVVSLTPEDGSKWGASGSTNKNGTAALSTSYGFKGVPEGKYTIAFVRIIQNPDFDDNDPKSMPFRSLIPAKYGKGKSKETVEIKAGEKNKFTFELDAGEEFVR